MVQSIYGPTGLRRPETYPVGKGNAEFDRSGLRNPLWVKPQDPWRKDTVHYPNKWSSIIYK